MRPAASPFLRHRPSHHPRPRRGGWVKVLVPAPSITPPSASPRPWAEAAVGCCGQSRERQSAIISVVRKKAVRQQLVDSASCPDTDVPTNLQGLHSTCRLMACLMKEGKRSGRIGSVQKN
ncbi:uncharacterized protein LOC124658444 [Lolium rigidum]|uniref:uncharacterized protein LOC124658444 n=1 Tax=Lolium rigidum TaxID=89674 RepID=UPI001F5C5490|nr:uncharacterized protein LOC124658444 [Lolium rigidum]